MRASLLAAAGVVCTAAALSLLGARSRAAPPPPGASAPAPLPAPPAARAASADAALPATSDRVVTYTLAAELLPDTHAVRGSGAITWRNTARVATDKLYVHLYLNAFKDDRTVFWRTPVSGFRGDNLGAPGRIEVERLFARELGQDIWPASPTTPGDPDDATDILVPLPRPIEPGESLTFDVAWTSRLPTVTLRTGYLGSYHAVAQWFPKIARLEPDGEWRHFPYHRLSEFYADYGVYDVTVTAPERFDVGAVGALVSEGPAESAPAGDSAKPETAPRRARRFVAEDVHDFAFFAWDRFHRVEDATRDGVKIACLFPEGHDDAARLEIDTVKFGLGYFGAAFGAYPYKTLTIVHPPAGAIETGGMEYPTLITTGGSGTPGAHELEILTLHELAHQWFYGLVGTDEHRSPFLDEGLTSYAEMDAVEALYPDASAVETPWLRVGMPAVYRAGALSAARDASASDAAPSFISGKDYGALVYGRTATTLRTLANVYGQDTARRAVGAYARRRRFGHPSPDDFFADMRAAFGDRGDEIEAALRAALTEPSSVDYVAEEVSSEPRGDGEPGWRGHALVRRRGSIRLPVDVLLIAADGSTRTVRWGAERAADRVPYEGDEPLVGAVIDPEHRVLLDEDLSNNAVSASGSRFAWRALEGGAFLGGALARGLLP